MDPFSLAVGALGITEVSISSFKHICRLIKGLARTEKEVHEIRIHLNEIVETLEVLRFLEDTEPDISAALATDLRRAGVASAVNKCGVACDTFARKLEEWTRRSNPDRFSWRDRFSIGVWNREKIKAFHNQVLDCRSRVEFAIQTAQL